jgi:hypothetical protein
MPQVAKDRFDWVPIDAERLKRIYDDLVTGAGATVLFHTVLAGVRQGEGGRVEALLLAGKRGLTAARAKAYVDGTGDGDLAAWAGAEWQKGDGGGDLQPATLCFTLANVDMYAYQHQGTIRFGAGEPAINRILASGRYPLIADSHACNNTVGPGVVGFNSGHIWNVDSTDPASVTAGLIQGRKIADSYRQAVAEFFPAAFANAFLVATAPLLGCRESRRIVGDYLLTVEDYLARRSFPDEICRNAYFIDVHHAQADAAKTRDLGWFEKTTHRYGPGESHGIPYRCLTPKGLADVLVAGRCISTDRTVQGSTRPMPTCLAMGEAAGVAAAMAARQPSADVHAVDAQSLRARLRERGAYLP